MTRHAWILPGLRQIFIGRAPEDHAAGLRYHIEHDGRRWAVTAVYLLWRA
jgi:hypothetical protein